MPQDPSSPAPTPPAKPIVRSYPTPDLRDRIYVEQRDARKGEFTLPAKGDPYTGREADRYQGFVFSTAQPADRVGWTDLFYLNERENQDAYNFTIEYPWVDSCYPRYTRTYVLLREDYKEPCHGQKDSANEKCVLVDFKVTRLEDPVLDALFVGVTKTFERVPAPTKVVLDRPESVLPFNMRVAVPAITQTTVQEDATDGEAPEIVNEEDWHIEESTDTAFRKTVDRVKRVVPPEGETLDAGYKLTPEQQLGHVVQTWKIGPQVIVPRATIIAATVEDIGNNTTMLETTEVPRVFPAGEFRVQIPDTIPIEFRDLLPIRTTGITSEGQAQPPTLLPGELERVSEQRTELIKRDTVTGRDIDQLPKVLIDKELDGIDTKGSEFGGVFDIIRTLTRADTPPNQTVDEGFGVIASKLTRLGSNLNLKETRRLSNLQAAQLQLTNPGSGFICPPAVVFSGGTFGTGATAVATVSAIPGGGGGSGDPGGTFPLSFSSHGDANGLFYFLGARYNSGVWTNPYTAGIIDIDVKSNLPLSNSQRAALVDREPSTTSIYMQDGGGHYYLFDLEIGRAIVVDRFTFRTPNSNILLQTIRVEGSNDQVNFTDLTGDFVLPQSTSTWVSKIVTDTTAWRYFRVFRTDTNDENTPFRLGEIEIYGTLAIVPAVQLNHVFNGDENGVFFHLGQRGGNGTWRNPHTFGDIVASSDGLAEGTLDGLVDREPSNINTDATANRSYFFDLKAGRSLLCNKMSFRQRTGFGSATYSFVLQARDSVSDPWTSLLTVFPPTTRDTWLTTSVPGTTSYRYFRVTSAQPYFTIGEIELYGSLILGPAVGGSGGAVTSINITAGGSNYTTAPEVRISNGGGTGATAEAVVVNGEVTEVVITNPGSGYTSPPDVNFFVPGGGSGAAGTASLIADTVGSIAVTSGGSEYGDAPLVELIGDGSGATAVAVVSNTGIVTGFTVTSPGSGYTIAPAVLLRNLGGPSAIATLGRGVASVTVDNGGSGYNAPPAVRFAGDGVGASAVSTLGFGVDSIVVTERGSGYNSTPLVSFGGGTGGSGAAATAIRGFPIASVVYTPNATLYLDPPEIVVTGGGIYGQDAYFFAVIGRPLLMIGVTVPGSNYSSNPAVVIDPPTGSGTQAVASSVRSFEVDFITTDNGGSGYTFIPTVEIEPPTGARGVQATARAVLTAGAVSAIVIEEPGFGYLTTPGVQIIGDGINAAATATLETSGAIDSIIISNVGSNYDVIPEVSFTGGGGIDAAAVAILNTAISGLLKRIDVINPGSGYTSAPTLTIAGGAIPSAALSTSGQIVAVVVTNPGSGYLIRPMVVFTAGGNGVGAEAVSALTPTGSVKSVTVLDPGSRYAVTPAVNFQGGGGSGATATAVMQSTASIRDLILIDPGPEYTVAPLVSFVGCGGSGATALYLLATGFPILTDIITDPTEGIIVSVVKKIVPAGTPRPAEGHVDIYALDKYRSIQITSAVDFSVLPPPDIFGQTHVLNLPPQLLSVAALYATDHSEGVGIDTRFGSTSVKVGVRGKIRAHIQDGIRGPAKAQVIRTFLFGPPSIGLTPAPLIITPTSGTAYVTSRSSEQKTSLGVRGGFGYIEDAIDRDEAIDFLDISGVLTGGVAASTSSSTGFSDVVALIQSANARAQSAGFFFDLTRTMIARNEVSAQANLVVDIPPSCPTSIPEGTTFLLSAGVEKWRFGVFVQTLVYVTVPTRCPTGVGGY